MAYVNRGITYARLDNKSPLSAADMFGTLINPAQRVSKTMVFTIGGEGRVQLALPFLCISSRNCLYNPIISGEELVN